jgi:hypothetical protein
MPRLTRVRAVPWAILLELGVTVRDAWMKLTPGERAHLTNLVKKSQGRPGNLTAREREDVKRLVRKMEPAALGRRLAPLGRKARGRRR